MFVLMLPNIPYSTKQKVKGSDNVKLVVGNYGDKNILRDIFQIISI